MCYAVTCHVCGKTTWDGCGQHIDDVMRSVPPDQRCRCAPRTNIPRGITAMVRRRLRG